MMKKPPLLLFARVAIAILLLLLLFLFGRLHFDLFERIDYLVLASTIPLYVLGFLVAIYRWLCLIRALGIPISLWDTTRLTMSGMWISSVVPGGSVFAGDVARTAIFAFESPNNRLRVLGSVVMDRLLGLIAILVIAAVALLFNKALLIGNRYLQILGLVIVSLIVAAFGVLALAMSRRLYNRVSSLQILKKMPQHTLLLKILDSFFLFRSHPWVLIRAHLVSYLGHGSMIAAICIIAQSIGIHLQNISEYLFAIAVGIISAMIPISGPAGIGSGNVGFALSFSLVHSKYGAELALLWQVTFMLASQLGLPFFLMGRKAGDPGQNRAD